MIWKICISTVFALATIFLLTCGGNFCLRKLFIITDLKKDFPNKENVNYKAGSIIGWLERLILAAGVLSQSWEILTAVIALKTVARFKELDDKLPAEYFLIGSLFSILWAIGITTAWLAIDHTFGSNVCGRVAKMVHGAG